MKSLVAIAFLCVGCVVLVAQAAPGRAGARPAFHWNFRDAKELDSRDALAGSKDLSPKDKALLKQALFNELRPGKNEPSVSDTQLAQEADATRIKPIDLNGDGTPEIIAQASGQDAGCSPTGNCPFWVFQRTESGYELLLEADSRQTFTIQPERTNRFNDLVLGMHGSATEQRLFVYRYSLRKYRRNDCYDTRWEFEVGGEMREVKRPILTRCH